MSTEKKKLSEFISEYSVRNKSREDIPVYSVSNEKGFCRDYFGRDLSSDDKSGYKIVPHGFFAYNPSRINVGSVACQFAEEKVIVSPLYVVFGTNDKMLNTYLLYYLKSKVGQDYIKAYARGAVRNSFSITKLGGLSVPAPDLSEQEAIVQELDSIKSIIRAKQQQISELERLSMTIFYNMFGDPCTNNKNWDVKRIGEIGKFQRGGGFQKSDFVEEGFPCIHYGQIHMRFGSVTKKHLTCIPNVLAEKKGKIAKTGDVILAITIEDLSGSCKCTAWWGDYDDAVSGHAAILKHEQNPIFLSYYFRTNAFSAAKERYAHGFKVTEITPDDISKISIYLPPIELQKQFADIVLDI